MDNLYISRDSGDVNRTAPRSGDANFRIELVVFNRNGVLNRITNAYSRRGYSIDSLHLDETRNPGLSRMVIASKGDEYVQTQMVRQLSKLYDVMEVKLMAAAQQTF